MNRQNVALRVDEVSHAYGERQALAGISLEVQQAEMFGLLGPNGGGKTTLFKILSTLMPLTQGRVSIFDHDLADHAGAIRARLGVVFQHPSLDPKLTVFENLQHHGHLYGLWGNALRQRSLAVLQRLGLLERRRDLVETLSGGLQRRVELAKALLHEPSILLLDEPSTGLDPGARLDFTATLEELRDKQQATILLTTHILEEAERCDRVGILHEGHLVALGTPDELKRQVGGDVVVIDSLEPETLRQRIAERFGCDPVVVDGNVRVEIEQGHAFVRDVVEAFADAIQAVTFGKPTLADVFIHLTGHQLWARQEETSA
ncbi:MAG: ABC transporter ATP-binding protein [Candidatus Entotheonella factor]|uniref:ABC transporter ATP-binding protein n=1 Tax=Entotheonella factor TaxID=1429438 RepID=W4LFS1_ENTF1|nr:MAG: ABC transporter ATP-binding protein [Candidatus Entotheonella factor]